LYSGEIEPDGKLRIFSVKEEGIPPVGFCTSPTTNTAYTCFFTSDEGEIEVYEFNGSGWCYLPMKKESNNY